MDEGGEDFIVQKKRSRRTKRKNIASSDSDDEFVPAVSDGRGTKRSCNGVDTATQQPNQRLSREEKQYQRAVEQAIAVSQCVSQSSTVSIVTSDTERKPRQSSSTSNNKEQEDVSGMDQEDGVEDDESDYSPPDEAVDSDDDFQPDSSVSKPSKPQKTPKTSSKPSSKARKTSNKSNGKDSSTARKKRNKDVEVTEKTEGGVSSTLSTPCAVLKSQLPGTKKKPVPTSSSSAVIGLNVRPQTGTSNTKNSSSTICSNMSGGGHSKPSGLKNSLTVRAGSVPIRTGGCAIRVGLSRKAPLKQLHKMSNST